MKNLSEQSFYEILEIPRTAPPDEVQRAYERARALFGPGSLVSYTLLPPDEAQVLYRRIEEARSVLLDPEARAIYDERLGPDGEPRPRVAAVGDPPAAVPAPRDPPAEQAASPAATAAAPPPPPAVPFEPPADGVWSGEVLRSAREARGVGIVQLSERTKVTRHHIENVEGERFDQLPVTVYLRGILLSIARELGLDGQKVARSYLERAAAASPPAKGR